MSRVVVALVVVLSACKTDNKPADPPKPVAHEPAPPAPKPPEPAAPAAPEPAKPAESSEKPTDAELEAKGFTIVSKMGDLFLADANDCEKLATDLKAFIAENKPAMLQLSEMERRQTPEEKKAYNQRTKAKQDEMMKRIQPAVEACKTNANVQAAMAEIPD